ncbi:AAA family ATPase [Methylocucumis oryzae]|uniref:Pilus assembly protein CpaE n=1 Tax=Methylocucumis oryzae TaxID=1632867 RepID=A0A0F3IH69_9GAMM|nr:hypothetical protein [Methylocucumis oryzae]KJV05893.1 hypothetical protein VZ94_14930 [Methylocucumis oryzae]
MESNLRVLITGYAKPELDELRITLSHLAGLNTTTLLANPSHDDPLYGVTTLPDVLILFLGQRAESVLKALGAKPAQLRPTTLVISTIGDNTALMRLAMQAGVRDFFPYPVLERELMETLKQVVREKSLKASGQNSQIFAVVNAKNGSGASMVAGNLAHITAVHEQARVALMDMDMQFGTQALNFNIHPQQGIFETLPVIDTLDSVALNSFMTVHKKWFSVINHVA